MRSMRADGDFELQEGGRAVPGQHVLRRLVLQIAADARELARLEGYARRPARRLRAQKLGGSFDEIEACADDPSAGDLRDELRIETFVPLGEALVRRLEVPEDGLGLEREREIPARDVGRLPFEIQV